MEDEVPEGVFRDELGLDVGVLPRVKAVLALECLQTHTVSTVSEVRWERLTCALGWYA